MLTFDKNSLDLLEAVVHDGEFKLADLTPDSNNNVALNLRRPSWENQIKKGKFFFQRIIVKEVYSQLLFRNFEKVEFNWKDPAFNMPKDVHTIFNVYFNDSTLKLTLDTAYLEVTFTLRPDFSITLTDTIGPTTTTFLNIVGWTGFDYDQWKRDYESRTKTTA